MKLENIFIIEFVAFVIKDCITEVISFEKVSYEKRVGKAFDKGVTKSICWELINKLIDCVNSTGVKNHKGTTIITANKIHIRVVDRFFDFICFSNFLYKGVKINAKKIPKRADNKKGFIIKKDSTRRAKIINPAVIFLT